MLDPYGPLVAAVTLPDNANLVAPKGGAAGSMPINTPQLTLSSLAFLLDDFSFQDVPSPRRGLRDTIMFELDVPTFTSGRQAQQEGVPAEHQGKILGVLDRLGHIKWVAPEVQQIASQGHFTHTLYALSPFAGCASLARQWRATFSSTLTPCRLKRFA